jgi:hypothetical protein
MSVRSPSNSQLRKQISLVHDEPEAVIPVERYINSINIRIYNYLKDS